MADQKAKVLVIDDEAGPRESLRFLLKTRYEVFTATRVDEGLEQLRTNQPDLIISDIRMPGKTGIQGLEEIRKIDPHVAVIMLTGYGELETAQKAIRLGASDYLKKPFDTGEMLETVERNIRKSTLNKRRAQAEEDLQALTERLSTEVDEKDRMASMGMASAELVHDLRNPLAVVLGYVELMNYELEHLKEQGLSEDLIEYIESIEKNVQRCARLTDVWHNLGKTQQAEMEDISIADTLKDLTSGAAKLHPYADIQLQITPEKAPLTVHADSIQLYRALQNIVNNAAQAVEGSKKQNVRVSAEQLENQVRIVVQDTGCGIDTETIRWIFDPFFTTKSVKKGTGLGLFITKKVIDDHQGSIRYESQVNVGTTATIRLPLKPA
jgi:signal transduction histidine kinase